MLRRAVAHKRNQPAIALLLSCISLGLVLLDLFTPSDLILMAAQPLVMAIGGSVLSRRLTLCLLGVVGAAYAIAFIAGVEQLVTGLLLLVVSAVLGWATLRLADRVSQRDRLIDYLSDQLRTPAALIRGYVSMARDGDVSSDLAIEQVDKASLLLNNMLEGGLQEGRQMTGAEAVNPDKPDLGVWYGIDPELPDHQ